MERFFIMFCCAIALVSALGLLMKRLRRPAEAWPYCQKKLLTKTEQELYFKLTEALPEYLVFPQVSLAQALGIKKGLADHYNWLNKINRMSLDFVICQQDAARIVAFIELDDPTHERKDRREADEKKNMACASAGVALIRWQTNAVPDRSGIRRQVGQAAQALKKK